MVASLKQMAARVRAFVTRDTLDRDFVQELESHLGMLTEENIRRGMTPDEARRAAAIRVGAGSSMRDQHRDARGLPALETLVHDVRFAFRLLARNRGFSAAAVAALALGIGVNATGFTILNAAFLRGLPFEDGRLYMVSWQTRSGDRSSVSFADLQDWRARTRTFAALAGFSGEPVNISDDRTWPEEVRGAEVTANAFDVLRVRPVHGRVFVPGDERKGAERVAIIGASLWRSRYGEDPSVLGKPLRVNGQPSTIVGVVPDHMKFPENAIVWVPFIPTGVQEQRNVRPLGVFGRLADTIGRSTAQAELTGIARQLATEHPDTNNDLTGVRVETFTEHFVRGPARVMFLAVMGAVCLVLLIACANVANLLLSRSAQRSREIAMRVALGATRWRIVRQLLIESLVLAVLGGSIGLLLAIAGVRLFDGAVQDPGKPYWIVFSADYVVFGYVAAICALTAIVFGLAPALQASKAGDIRGLKEGGRGTVGDRRARLVSGGIVVAELALSVILLAGAGLMVRSFMNLYTQDIGFSTDDLATMRMQLPGARYASAEARRAFFERLEGRLSGVAGIEAVALTSGVPPRAGGERLLQIDEPTLQSEERLRFVSTVTITPRFFEVLGVPIVRGRALHDVDGAPGSEAVIINESLASQFFPGEDPIGRRLRFTQRQPPPGSQAPVWRTIVGVTRSIRQGSPQDAHLNPVVYVPYRQDSRGTMSLLVRSGLPPASVMEAVRGEVQAIDRDQPVFTIRTLDQVIRESRWPQRVFGSVFAIFAAIALVLSSVGLYAVMAYSVAQRTQEIGTRIALGARSGQVSWMILKGGLGQLVVGLMLGLPCAWALSRLIERVLVDTAPGDPVTFAVVTILLTAVSIAACLIPARRATRVDPLTALRAE